MRRDKKIILTGLGVNDPKGIFGTTKNLHKIFGKQRVIEPPTSENAITGICLGVASCGMKPILSHQRVEFSLLSLEQIFNQIAKWEFMTAHKSKISMIIRLIIGKGWGQGPQHSQSLESLFAHIPGLVVVAPSNPYDAKGLLVSSLKINKPVILFEHRWLHETKSFVPNKIYDVKIGQAKLISKGKDLTIISYSEGLNKLRNISRILKESKISADIIDLRTIRPLDKKTIIKSIKKTRSLLVLDNGWKTYGISSEIIALLAENFSNKKIKYLRLGLKEEPISSTRALAKNSYVSFKSIFNAISQITKKKFKRALKEKFLKDIKKQNDDVPNKDFLGPF